MKTSNEEIHYGQGIVDMYIDASSGKSERFGTTGAGVYLRHENGQSWMYFLGADHYVPQSEVWACALALSLIPAHIPINICTDYLPLYDFFVAGNNRQNFYHMREGGRFFSELTQKLKKRKYTKTMVNSMTNRHHLVAHNLANMGRILVKNKMYINENTFYVPKENRAFCLWSRDTPFFDVCQRDFFCFLDDVVKESFYPFKGVFLDDFQGDYIDDELEFIHYNKKGKRSEQEVYQKEKEVKKETTTDVISSKITNYRIPKKRFKMRPDNYNQKTTTIETNKKTKKEKKKERRAKAIETQRQDICLEPAVEPTTKEEKINEITKEFLQKNKETEEPTEIEKYKKPINENEEEDIEIFSMDFSCNVQRNVFKGRKYLSLSHMKENSQTFNNWRKKNPSKLISPGLECIDFSFSKPPSFIYRVPSDDINDISGNLNFFVDPDLIKEAMFKTVGVYCVFHKENIWKDETLTKGLVLFLRKISLFLSEVVIGKKYAHASALLLNMPEKEHLSQFLLDKLYFFQKAFGITFLTGNGTPLGGYYFSECDEVIYPELWKKAGIL